MIDVGLRESVGDLIDEFRKFVGRKEVRATGFNVVRK